VLDYLVSNTAELEKYRSSVSFRPILLPAMQPKKAEKKHAGKAGDNQGGHHPKPKKGIFPPQEESHTRANIPPPHLPGPPKRKEEEQSSSGFSPYDNAPKQPTDRPQPPAPKKNLNTPPPPPISNKKTINQPQLHEEER
jgi:hypothetical protein